MPRDVELRVAIKRLFAALQQDQITVEVYRKDLELLLAVWKIKTQPPAA